MQRTLTKMHARRRLLGLSQAAVAEMLGVSQSHVSGWETRTAKIPPRHLAKLSRILGVSASELTDDYGPF